MAETEMLQAQAPSSKPTWKLWAVVIWLSFSIALAAWWMMYGLRQIDRFSQLGASPAVAEEIARQHRMLMSEGATLILLLLGGGAALLYYIGTEVRRAQKIREFFAAFTHDMKTSLASLRLQAESLEEDLQKSEHAKLIRRLVKDTVRLELQLENSLLLASPDDSSRLLKESVKIGDILRSMQHQWPELEIRATGDGFALADRRAVESIFKNFIQNAVVHGRATRIDVSVSSAANRITTRFDDNGRGFAGDVEKLGRMFERHASTSGSGLGLYLATKLAREMNGDVAISKADKGFSVTVTLQEAGGGA
jgi:signal transduction histidine kinase